MMYGFLVKSGASLADRARPMYPTHSTSGHQLVNSFLWGFLATYKDIRLGTGWSTMSGRAQAGTCVVMTRCRIQRWIRQLLPYSGCSCRRHRLLVHLSLPCCIIVGGVYYLRVVMMVSRFNRGASTKEMIILIAKRRWNEWTELQKYQCSRYPSDYIPIFTSKSIFQASITLCEGI